MGIIRMTVLAALCLSAGARAQPDTKEMRTLKLRLKEAQLQLQQARAREQKTKTSVNEAKELYAEGLLNKTEMTREEELFELAQLEREQAEIALEKTRLTFLNDALHITLDKAALYRDDQGNKHVLLHLSNTSNTRKILDEAGEYSDTEKRDLVTIENLTVRILLDGKLIGRPFEKVIPLLPYRQRRQADFILQRDTDAVTVEMSYGDTTIVMPVFLEKEAKEDRVMIEAMLFSQEGELGTRIYYDLSLERFVEDNKSFALDILNLPGDYTYEFRELDSESGEGEQRVSQIRFKKDVTAKQIRLIINMPRELDKESLNSRISFFVVVLDRFARQRLSELKNAVAGRAVTAEELDSASVSHEKLELIPRGKAELTIVSSNLFHKGRIGEPVVFEYFIHNTGTVNLDRIRTELTLPLNWTATVAPHKDISVDVGAKEKIAVEAIPAIDAVAGDYEATIDATTMHEGREIEAVDKIMRIQLEGKSNFLIGAILMTVLIGMIVGVAVVTIRISRR